MDFDQFIKELNEYKSTVANSEMPVKILIQSSSNFNILGIPEEDHLSINIIRID